MKKNDQFVNEDTYQTLTELKTDPQPHEKAVMPLWKDKSEEKVPKANYSVFIATPVHSDCSIHYAQTLLEFQKMALEKGVKTQFCLLKSSLITQGRNLCVSSFLETKHTHMLFIDSDIYFHSPSIFKMIERDKEIMSIPYPLKTMMWDKLFNKIQQGKVKKPEDLKKWLNTYPMKVR